jgi:glycosyltransferase involved in cell wall biosynthesis
MKILLIANMYPSKSYPTYGIFVKNFVEQMSTCGFLITPVVIEGRGVNVFEKMCKYARFIFGTVKALNKDEYDVVYVHYIGHSLFPFLFTKRNLGRPLVINAHGGDIFTITRLGGLIQKLVSPVIRKTDLLVVPSAYFSEVVSKKFSVPSSSIFVSPSGGVNRELFKTKASISRLPLFTIGYVSRIDEGKGWDVLLRAVDLLHKTGIRNFQVLMVGGGAQVKQLRAMLINLNLGEHVHYIGPVDHQELPSYYHQMDIFVFPTRLPESLGLVGVEALACGVPVVGSDIGALPGYIKPGYNGKLFSPGDSAQLAECLKEMMHLDIGEMNIYRRNAAELARQYESVSVSQGMKVKLEQVVANFCRARLSK